MHKEGLVKYAMASFLAVLALCAQVAAHLFAGGVDGAPQAPRWVTDAQPIAPEDIPRSDYPFLRAWIDRHAQPAEEYLIQLFQRHDVVLFGEAHNVAEHKDLIIAMIPRLYRDAGVRCVGWEFSNPTANEELERLVTAASSDRNALLDFARSQISHAWNSREHWDLIEAVRALNASLPAGSPKMRFVGIDSRIDWVDTYTKIKTLPKDSPEMQRLFTEVELKRDVVMAENVERDIIAKGVKGLLFVGSGHAETHVGRPPDKPYRRPIMGKILYDKYGDKVFHVFPDTGRFQLMNTLMEGRVGRPVGFDVAASPFSALVLEGVGIDTAKMSSLARGFVYFGTREQLHRNTTIPGFVTDEMFEKYQEYYRIDFGRPFKSAKEVNEYFQETLWSGGGARK